MLLLFQQIGTSHQFIHRADSKLRHILPQLLRNEIHEIDHVFRFPLKTLPKLRILRRNSHRARIQIADPHHHASHGYKGSRRKSELLRPQHTGNRHITACHQLAVSLQDHLVAEAVHNQGLVCFRHPQFPWKPCIVNGISRCRPRSAVKGGDQDHLCSRLGDACRDGADSSLRYQLHRDSGLRVGIFQVVDQLCQVLDGVDIMVRRR